MSFNGAPSYSPRHLGHPRWISVFLQLKTGFIFTPLSVIKNVQKMLFGKCSATRQLTPSLPESCSSLIWCLGAQSCNDASMPLQIASAKRTEQKAEPLNLHTIDQVILLHAFAANKLCQSAACAKLHDQVVVGFVLSKWVLSTHVDQGALPAQSFQTCGTWQMPLNRTNKKGSDGKRSKQETNSPN